MSCVTAVEGEWLAELGPMFFSIKESFETTLRKRQELKEAKKMMELELEAKAKKEKEEQQEKGGTESALASRRRYAVATPGRQTTGATPRFKPKSGRRVGL
mmetsp:Transcript_46962/g.93003  ORF Transcript_46962/g.93003 Transcript_46962/m.93003 type:complete len:101 (+) Transcript_46962:2-304(+)